MSLFDFLSSNILATNIVLVLLMVVSMIYLVAFVQGRPISFWPPRIGARPTSSGESTAASRETDEESLSLENCGILKTEYFNEFSDEFDSLIENTENIVLYFIHSRRWRENHLDQLANFLERRRNQLTVILPNLANEELIYALKEHFDDGDNIEAFIKDAYRYFASFQRRRPEGLDIRLSDLYPTYSFYKFDDFLIFAMYPTTPRRKGVPTFKVKRGSKYWDFVSDDIQWMLSNTKSVNSEDLHRLVVS